MPSLADDLLTAFHYLGPGRGEVYEDDFGVILTKVGPSSRMLPKTWLELTRWCIVSTEPNAGSQQWASYLKWVRTAHPEASTIVSYSDPGVGHDGGLYRATNWRWAPVWHVLRPPPSGGGSWDGGKTRQGVKHRWVFPLRPDPERASVLALRDASLRRRMPWAEYTEPTWKRGKPTGGGGDYKRWLAQVVEPGS